jgi:hypothetical protein
MTIEQILAITAFAAILIGCTMSRARHPAPPVKVAGERQPNRRRIEGRLGYPASPAILLMMHSGW